MAKLYVANVTPQHQVINYRLDFRVDGERDGRVVIPPKSSPPIPPGRQMPIGGDLHPSQIQSIMEQLEPYGLIAEAEIGRMPQGRKVTFVCNIDREVSAESIRQAHAHNTGVKVQDGKERRQRAAIAASEVISKTVEDQTAQTGLPAPMREFDLSVEQQEPSENDNPPLAEGHRVPVGAEAAEVPGRGRGRGGRTRPQA